MESVIRALVVYFFLMVVFRVAGRRALAEMTTFDFILVLIVSETTQEALIDDDKSLTNAALLILTLIGTNIVLSVLKYYSSTLDKWIDGRAFIIVEDGKCLKDRMAKARVDKGDIMEAARRNHGLKTLDQIKYAVLERDGQISIIPREETGDS
jgi:uncharacterized membrane protein YcaP (DUF421 family)